jgi:hypothetical protein
MVDHELVRVLLLDDAPAAGREAALREALYAASRGVSFSGRMVQVDLTARRLRDVVAADRPELADMVLIAISEDRVSSLTSDESVEGGGRLPRIACGSVRAGYDLLRNEGRRPDVYFLLRPPVSYGLHVLSLVLSGADGVLDAEYAGSSHVAAWLLQRRLRHLANAKWASSRSTGLTLSNATRKVTALAGRPAEALDRLIDIARADWHIDFPRWELLLALAQVPRERLGPRPRTPSQTWVKAALDNWAHVTGYVGGEGVRRRIPSVFDLLRDDEETMLADSPADREGRRRALTSQEMQELPALPALARSKGFPNQLLPVRGVDDSALAHTLYRGLDRVQPYWSQEQDGVTLRLVTLPCQL